MGNRKLTGIVLCGGKSSRMGCDKGLIRCGNKTWAGIAMEKLAHFCNDVYLSVHTGQLEEYSELFPSEILITDDPDIKKHFSGPLAGMLTAAKKYPQNDFLVLACDMPDMEIVWLEKLVVAYNSHPDYIAYAFREELYFEPLCAIYTRSVLKKLIDKKPGVTIGSFQELLNRYDARSIFLEAPKDGAFTNHNYLV